MPENDAVKALDKKLDAHNTTVTSEIKKLSESLSKFALGQERINGQMSTSIASLTGKVNATASTAARAERVAEEVRSTLDDELREDRTEARRQREELQRQLADTKERAEGRSKRRSQREHDSEPPSKGNGKLLAWIANNLKTIFLGMLASGAAVGGGTVVMTEQQEKKANNNATAKQKTDQVERDRGRSTRRDLARRHRDRGDSGPAAGGTGGGGAGGG